MALSAAAEAYDLEQKLAVMRAQKGLLGFTLSAYPDFRPSWHHRRLAQTVNAMAGGLTPRQLLKSWGIDGKQLVSLMARPHPNTGLYAGMSHPEMIDLPISNMQAWLPPRHSKSWMISVALPSWWLGRNPDHQVLAASYGRELTDEMSTGVLNTVGGSAFREIFSDVRLSKNVSSAETVQKAKMTMRAFDIVGRRGKYRATSIGAAATGRGSDLLVCDDPFKDRNSAESAKERMTVWNWWRSTAFTRGQKGVRRCLINTRWHQADLSSLCLSVAKADPKAAQWFVVCFPAILDTDPTPGDPRRQGEALWSEFYPQSSLDQIRRTIGPYEWEALYQQRPTPSGGGVIKDSWWQYYTRLPEKLTDWTISCDLTFGSLHGEVDRGDYVAMTVWACDKANRYLVDMTHARLTFTEQVRALQNLSNKYPQCKAKLVEDAASARAVIHTLRSTVQGLIAVKPEGSKQMRVDAISPQIEAGNVFLPSPEIAAWTESVRAEFSAFPAGAHDDIVDSCSMALFRMGSKKSYLHGTAPGSITRKSPWISGARS